MGKLILNRNSEWNNKGRNFRLFIDGTEIGKIANGETQELELESGKHQFYAKIDWCRSKTIDFELSENEIKTIELTGFKYRNLVVSISLGILLVYYIIKYALKIEMDFLKVIVCLGFLYPIYYLTFGKNRYIKVHEINTKSNKNMLQHRV